MKLKITITGSQARVCLVLQEAGTLSPPTQCTQTFMHLPSHSRPLLTLPDPSWPLLPPPSPSWPLLGPPDPTGPTWLLCLHLLSSGSRHLHGGFLTWWVFNTSRSSLQPALLESPPAPQRQISEFVVTLRSKRSHPGRIPTLACRL